MSTPAPDWMPASCRLAYPRWVQRKAVTLCKRDQKCGGTGNVQQYRLAIHAAVLASEGRDHWTGEPLDWELLGSDDNNDAAAANGAQRNAHNTAHQAAPRHARTNVDKKQYALLPTIDHRTNTPEADFVICAWRTNEAKHGMTPEELLAFCRAVIAHSPNWMSAG